MDEDTNPVEQTQFNASIATLMRLHKWLEAANEYYAINDINGYYKCLMIVLKEVFVKATPAEKTNLQNDQKEIVKKFSNYTINSSKKITNFTSDILKDLFNFDIKLRKIADDHGMMATSTKNVFESMGAGKK